MAAITILTPVWNGFPYFRECAESVLNQSFTDWEWIIGDNCSTDGTREFLDTLQDPRITIIKHDRNKGIYGNLNALFAAATAPISYILCSDDYFLPGGLELAVKEWAKVDDSVALIRFNWTEEGRAKSSLRRHSFRSMPETVPPQDSDFYFFSYGNYPGNLSSVSVRPGAVRESGDCREDLPYVGDFNIWSRIGRKWSVRISQLDTTFVRRHPGVASNYLNKKGELIGEQREIANDLYGRLLDAGIPARWLRLHATLLYDIYHRHCGVRAILAGEGFHYLNLVQAQVRTSPSILPNFWCWILYFASVGGRLLRPWSATKLRQFKR